MGNAPTTHPATSRCANRNLHEEIGVASPSAGLKPSSYATSSASYVGSLEAGAEVAFKDGKSGRKQAARQEVRKFRRPHEGGKRSRLSARQLAALRALQLRDVEPNPGPTQRRAPPHPLEGWCARLTQAVVLFRGHTTTTAYCWVAGWDEESVDTDSPHTLVHVPTLRMLCQDPLFDAAFRDCCRWVEERQHDLDPILVAFLKSGGWVRDLTREGVEKNPGPCKVCPFCWLNSWLAVRRHPHCEASLYIGRRTIWLVCSCDLEHYTLSFCAPCWRRLMAGRSHAGAVRSALTRKRDVTRPEPPVDLTQYGVEPNPGPCSAGISCSLEIHYVWKKRPKTQEKPAPDQAGGAPGKPDVAGDAFKKREGARAAKNPDTHPRLFDKHPCPRASCDDCDTDGNAEHHHRAAAVPKWAKKTTTIVQEAMEEMREKEEAYQDTAMPADAEPSRQSMVVQEVAAPEVPEVKSVEESKEVAVPEVPEVKPVEENKESKAHNHTAKKADAERSKQSPPLTKRAILARMYSLPAPQRKAFLGETLYPLVQKIDAGRAGKLTGMLLDMEPHEVAHLCERPEALVRKVNEAQEVLRNYTEGLVGALQRCSLNIQAEAEKAYPGEGAVIADAVVQAHLGKTASDTVDTLRGILLDPRATSDVIRNARGKIPRSAPSRPRPLPKPQLAAPAARAAPVAVAVVPAVALALPPVIPVARVAPIPAVIAPAVAPPPAVADDPKPLVVPPPPAAEALGVVAAAGLVDAPTLGFERAIAPVAPPLDEVLHHHPVNLDPVVDGGGGHLGGLLGGEPLAPDRGGAHAPLALPLDEEVREEGPEPQYPNCLSVHKCASRTHCVVCGLCSSSYCAEAFPADCCPRVGASRGCLAGRSADELKSYKWTPCMAAVFELPYEVVDSAGHRAEFKPFTIGRAFRAQSPKDKNQWRTIGQFMFDVCSHIVSPREAQVEEVFSRSIPGAHLYFQEEIFEATPKAFKVPLAGEWRRRSEHVRMKYCNDLDYRGYHDYWYDEDLFRMLVSSEKTAYMVGLSRRGQGVQCVEQARTLAQADYANYDALAKNYNMILEQTLHMFQNFLVVRSLMGAGATPGLVRQTTVQNFRYLAASQPEQSGAASGGKVPAKLK